MSRGANGLPKNFGVYFVRLEKVKHQNFRAADLEENKTENQTKTRKSVKHETILIQYTHIKKNKL